MNEAALLSEINADLQSAPARKVVYLEGKTDTPMFFGLLGVVAPRDGLHKGVLVRGLKDTSGMGGSSVRSRVELASAKGYPGIYGVVDGDGRTLAELSASFNPPFAGPLFSWKAYCIESLIVKTGWPAAWGTPPDWTEVLLDHAPYVALNRIFRDLQGKLETLHLSRFTKPQACRDAWVAHATSAGGLPEVRSLWERITGSPP